MAFYFSQENFSFYDTDVFPIASLPSSRVEITEEVYNELLTKQNQGYVIKADNSGNPYAVTQGESSATDMKHSGSIATAVDLGHVKIGNTMKTDSNGVLDVNNNAISAAQIADGSITTPKLADGAVTTAKIENGAVTEEKLDSVKDLLADETSLTMAETANEFTLSVKDGGISRNKIADAAINAAKIEDGGISRTKIADAAINAAKIEDGGISRNKIADSAINAAKIEYGAVNILKLNSHLLPSILRFLDANEDDLEGRNIMHTFIESSDTVLLGHVPHPVTTSFVDFTLSFRFEIQQSTIGTDKTFMLHVWSGENMTPTTIIDSRTVVVTEGCPFVHERFFFVSLPSLDIKITFQYVSRVSNIFLSNVTLKGFSVFGV